MLTTLFVCDRRGIATDEYIQQMHHSTSRHALSDVISASQMVTTAQPMLGGGMGVIGGISGAGGGVSIGGAGAELKPRFYDEVRDQIRAPTLHIQFIHNLNVSAQLLASKISVKFSLYLSLSRTIYFSLYMHLIFDALFFSTSSFFGF